MSPHPINDRWLFIFLHFSSLCSLSLSSSISLLCFCCFPFILINLFFSSLFFQIFCSPFCSQNSPPLFFCHPSACLFPCHICPLSQQHYLLSVTPPTLQPMFFEAGSQIARGESQWSSSSAILSVLYHVTPNLMVHGHDCVVFHVHWWSRAIVFGTLWIRDLNSPWRIQLFTHKSG